LTVEAILRWADAQHERTGRWPSVRTGDVVDAPGETWATLNQALVRGSRGLPGGSSLAKLLAEHRDEQNHRRASRLTVKQILRWADLHHQQTGEWPNQYSGPVADAPGEVWQNINMALCVGVRGLPGGDSLARLLEEHRGVRRWAREV
jgi:hypothetical protein